MDGTQGESMNLQQLRFICEVARRDLKVSRVAELLHISQPSVSTQIRLLEEELGLTIFTRQRNRLTAITPVGGEIIERAQRALMEIDEIRQLASAHSADDSGTLTIAASHAQARFRLPAALRQFADRYPRVHITIRPESGRQITDTLRAGQADIGILSSAKDLHGDLFGIPFQTYRRLLLVATGHPLLKVERPGFDDIARYPIVLYEPSQTGTVVLNTLERLGKQAPSVLKATNADVVKAYVEQGLGVCVLPELVFDPERDRGLRAINVDHLFSTSTTFIVLNRKHHLRAYAYAFIEILAPQVTRQSVERLHGQHQKPD
ncbi:transcriptional regulator CysB [Achromobacter aloeverae]|uniref:Transcriptional regulator CysB n=2 Tax=Achromobacter aloeverae TaxID=1750518 RepID=A0A4Q1HD79_9BURK|nr:transcriptional regulator CysB [Achromobacter aloeverae]